MVKGKKAVAEIFRFFKICFIKYALNLATCLFKLAGFIEYYVLDSIKIGADEFLNVYTSGGIHQNGFMQPGSSIKRVIPSGIPKTL